MSFTKVSVSALAILAAVYIQFQEKQDRLLPPPNSLAFPCQFRAVLLDGAAKWNIINSIVWLA